MAKQALVLCDCVVGDTYRKPGEVVEIEEADAVNYAGMVDFHPAAVRYALHGTIDKPAIQAEVKPEPTPEPVADAPKHRGRPKKQP
jgi:hypothetical protein